MKTAFTLIELLIVIAIMGILSALLFPVFTSAKRSAFKASSTSALRQSFVSSNLYSSDYEDRIPYAVDECDWRGLCTSSYSDEWRNMIQDNNIPSFTIALKPYGFVPSLFKIEVGSGPRDFESMGSNFYYDLKLSSSPLQRYEENACPYFTERKSYFWNGGIEGTVQADYRWLTLRFGGQIQFANYHDAFTKADECKALN